MAEFKYIDGLVQLSAALKELPTNVSRNVLRRAVSAGAAEIRNQAKLNAPVWDDKVQARRLSHRLW